MPECMQDRVHARWPRALLSRATRDLLPQATEVSLPTPSLNKDVEVVPTLPIIERNTRGVPRSLVEAAKSGGKGSKRAVGSYTDSVYRDDKVGHDREGVSGTPRQRPIHLG